MKQYFATPVEIDLVGAWHCDECDVDYPKEMLTETDGRMVCPKGDTHTLTANKDYVVSLSTGTDFTIALTADQSVYTWGYGEHGRLGHTSTTAAEAESKGVPTKLYQDSIDMATNWLYCPDCSSDEGHAVYHNKATDVRVDLNSTITMAACKAYWMACANGHKHKAVDLDFTGDV